MADVVEVVLEFLHVVFGVAWIGAVFYSVGVLRRAVPRIGMPARKEAMRQIIPVATHFIPMAAIATIVFGTLLYLVKGQFNPAALFESRWGLTILSAFGLTIGTFGFGMVFVVGTSRRVLGHLEEEACPHGDTVAGLQRRINSSQIITLALGLWIIGLMVLASSGV